MSKLRKLTRTWLRWVAEMEDKHGQPTAAGLAADMGLVEQERAMMSESQTIAEAFFADLMASFDNAHKCFEPLYLAFGDGSGDSVFGVNTRPGFIFDDLFWDVFHAHPLHVCHVTRLTDGPQFDDNRVFEIRFKISTNDIALEAKLSKMGEALLQIRDNSLAWEESNHIAEEALAGGDEEEAA